MIKRLFKNTIKQIVKDMFESGEITIGVSLEVIHENSNKYLTVTSGIYIDGNVVYRENNSVNLD